MKVLLTGATGFVGKALAAGLASDSEVDLTCAVRRSGLGCPGKVIVTGELDGRTDWSETLDGGDVVIHSAARAHIMKDEVADPLAEYRRVNVDGTLNLARQAVKAGVKRFIFVSSIKVNGEQTHPGKPFTENNEPNPQDAYGVSKREAEDGLMSLAHETGMEIVVIRPVLVYGPGVKGNFATLNKLVSKGIPLPLGAVKNRRSFVALDNLVDLIIMCLDHPAAANQVFLAADGQDMSTTELLEEIAEAMCKSPRLVPVPEGLLMFGATLLGKKAVAQRVLGSLQVDISKARNLLGWSPPLTPQEGLQQCFGQGSES